MREMMRDVWRFADKWIGDKKSVSYSPEQFCVALEDMESIVKMHPPENERFLREMLIVVYNEIVRRDINA